MRISDWSSDVCSSDLIGAFIFIPGISVMARSTPENCETNASLKCNSIFAVLATVELGAGVADTSLGCAWAAVPTTRAAGTAMANSDPRREIMQSSFLRGVRKIRSRGENPSYSSEIRIWLDLDMMLDITSQIGRAHV